MPTRPYAYLLPFWRNTRGTFAMTTALCAVPLLGMTGLAIDYGILLSNKSKLDAAADAAAIAALTKARAVLLNKGNVFDALIQGKQQGMMAFAANSGATFYSTSGSVVPNIQFAPTTGQSLAVNVTYQMTSYSQFGKLFNIPTHTIGGSSTSNTVLYPFYQLIFVVDVSNSMAVGGTSSDIAGLQNDSKIQCAFACHDVRRGNIDYRTIAKNDGWKLKIDYVNAAVQQFISSLSSQTANISGQFSVGIDTFGTSFNVTQAPINPPSLALSTAKAIDVESANNNNNGYTITTTGLNSALSNLSNIGDGSSSQSQATYVIFVSDGVEDTAKPGAQWGRTTDLSYGSACTAIKKAGATLVTIEASYPVIPGDDQYAALVKPLSTPNTPNMQTAMQACATDTTWAFKADDGPGISSAVSAVLKRVLQGLTRVTN